jgi:hypothetical protein
METLWMRSRRSLLVPCYGRGSKLGKMPSQFSETDPIPAESSFRLGANKSYKNKVFVGFGWIVEMPGPLGFVFLLMWTFCRWRTP